MMIVPEIETVVLLVPRTGSGSLYKALRARYPMSMLLYRHMEADGCPMGYDRWRRIGVVRNPLDRMWSLYKFLREGFTAADPTNNYQPYVRRLEDVRASVEMTFDQWLTTNQLVFCGAHDLHGGGKFWPVLSSRHSIPENFKSQRIWLRPDMGTEIWQFNDLNNLAAELDIELAHRNHTTSNSAPPTLSTEAAEHMRSYFDWDYGASYSYMPKAA